MKHLRSFLIISIVAILAYLIGRQLVDRIPSKQFTITPPEPEEVPVKIENVGFRIVTAYNAVPEQTDEEPCISASGMNVCETHKKICASNEFPFGTLLLIGDQVWEVQDRTHSRYKYRIDLLVDDYEEAREWGKRVLEIKKVTVLK